MSENDHMDHLRIVLQVLKENQIIAKFSKCEFWLRLVSICHIIPSEGVVVDPRKKDTVKICRRTWSPFDICSILGLLKYYRRFVEGFSSIASPLMVLTQNKSMFVWSDL